LPGSAVTRSGRPARGGAGWDDRSIRDDQSQLAGELGALRVIRFGLSAPPRRYSHPTGTACADAPIAFFALIALFL
ncbi:MAG: hypothetical protein ACRDTC_21615, partial [Pseudonocardiaceae bacterium]